ncbi:MAG: hypothetical protein H7A46_24595 [Verrucomicrobiales bacterium]|nr:hypothetical protein [Verrucomicrobiales bacterium]
MQLLGVGLREDGAFVFEIQGPPSAEGVLEQSENLRDWTDAGGVVLDTSGHARVEKQTGTTDAGRFYRVRLGP